MAFNLGEFLFGLGGKEHKIGKKTKQQMAALNQILQGGGLGDSLLYQGGSDFLQQLFGGDFEAFEAPLMRKFEQEVTPGIAERFAGMGAGSSSGLNQALARAGENLTAQLGAQRSQLMMQALPKALGYAQQPISNILAALGIDPYDNLFEEGNLGLIGEGALKFAEGAGKAMMG